MTFGSLFSGIGGIDLGLERAGMTCKWQVELDPYCRAVLDKHWPQVAKWDDATTFVADSWCERLEQDARGMDSGCGSAREEGDQSAAIVGGSRAFQRVDLICGGFPCQPVSHAGKRAGTSDARWLWPEFERIVRVLRPRYVLVENVPGLLTVNGGDAFGEVLGGLARCGYDAEWSSIPAAAVGAPHLRWRVFVVAYAQCGASELRRESRNVPGPWRETEVRGTRPVGEVAHTAGYGGEDVADATGVHVQGLFNGQGPIEPGRGSWWAVEPDVGRVAHGIPNRVDRLRALGNAVVPQVAEWVGRQIVRAEYAGE